MKPIGLHTSDTHLRARNGDEEHAFVQLVDRAIALQVKYLMLAGDLLDKQSNRARVIAFLFKQLDRCEEAGVEVLNQPFFAQDNVATAGGCLASSYLAAWIIARSEGVEAARAAIHYVAPVGEKDDYVDRAMGNIEPYLFTETALAT